MPAGNVKPHRLRPSAHRDLLDIWLFGADRWSHKQADLYVTGITEALDLLAANPAVVRERTEYDPSIRVYRYKAHIIVFREEADFLDVIRIRHGHEDWSNDPVGE